MTEYCIPLPNERARTTGYVTLFIVLINCLVFGIVFINSPTGKLKQVALAGTIISCISLVLFVLNFFRGKLPAYRPEISFIVLGMLWLIIGKYLLAVFTLCFAVIGIYARKKLNVLFSENNISYPSFPARHIPWSEVANVVLKDNVLTIDLKNNKLIQVVVEQAAAGAINEQNFNAFCKKQVQSQ